MANFRFSSKTTKQLGLAISVVVAPFLIYGLIWELPRHQAGQMQSKEKFDAEQAARIGWVQGLGAIFAAGTAVTTWKTYQENQRNANRNFQALQEKQDRDAAHAEKNLQALLEKNTADRFSKAIEQLGNETSIHVRLGGIFALEQIANTEDNYYWQIMEILTAYVRTRSPSSSESNKISDDIQAVMTVLSRRKRSYKNGEVHRLDLTHTNLNKLQLSTEAKFQGVDLSNAHLRGARLPKIHLEQAILFQANLETAFLPEANLDNSNLRFANLTDAELLQASLRSSDLWCAELINTNFQSADLRKAHIYSNLTNTRFNEANLEESDFRGYGSDFESIAPTQSQINSAKSYAGAKFTIATHN
jgi:uncharacterized protein YjbI with pentapeptide repeats